MIAFMLSSIYRKSILIFIVCLYKYILFLLMYSIFTNIHAHNTLQLHQTVSILTVLTNHKCITKVTHSNHMGWNRNRTATSRCGQTGGRFADSPVLEISNISRHTGKLTHRRRPICRKSASENTTTVTSSQPC